MSRCRKCGSKWLFAERIPVLDGTGFTELTQCYLCGDIYREHIIAAVPLRALDVTELKSNRRRRGCCVVGCDEPHHAMGYCRHHCQQEYVQAHAGA